MLYIKQLQNSKASSSMDRSVSKPFFKAVIKKQENFYSVQEIKKKNIAQNNNNIFDIKNSIKKGRGKLVRK